MTGPDPSREDTPGEPRRTGTDDDVAGWRIHYRLADDPPAADRWVHFATRRGMPVADAIAVQKATGGRVKAAQLLQVAQSSREAAADPEALQALVWLLHRRAGTPVTLASLDTLDVLSTWIEFTDADGVLLDIPDPEPAPDVQEAARTMADLIAADLPHLPREQIVATTAALIGANAASAPPPEDETPGEGSAGSAEPAKGKRTPRTRATSRRS